MLWHPISEVVHVALMDVHVLELHRINSDVEPGQYLCLLARLGSDISTITLVLGLLQERHDVGHVRLCHGAASAVGVALLPARLAPARRRARHEPGDAVHVPVLDRHESFDALRCQLDLAAIFTQGLACLDDFAPVRIESVLGDDRANLLTLVGFGLLWQVIQQLKAIVVEVSAPALSDEVLVLQLAIHWLLLFEKHRPCRQVLAAGERKAGFRRWSTQVDPGIWHRDSAVGTGVLVCICTAAAWHFS
mmetsp:Transcript_139324/g.445487  ORF Transcript_139324/g.445487 Transcript_139324/m.445487 type:complete len:248 (-) Transcript_139324:886-1629(-)